MMALYKNISRRIWMFSLSVVLVSLTTIGTLSVFPGHLSSNAAGIAASPAASSASQSLKTTDLAALVTEFDVNGLKVLVKRRAGSQTVSGGLFIRGGSQNITTQNAGIENLMMAVAAESSQSYPRDQLRSELASMGSGVAYGINNDYSVFTLASTRGNFDKTWDIFSDLVVRPSFAADDFARVKGQIITERQSEDDVPDSLLQELQAQTAYAGHPYLNDTHGTVESLNHVTLEDIRKYHQQIMQTSRLLLVIVGDLDPQQIEKRVNATLGKLPRGSYHSAMLPQLSFTTPTVEVTARDLPTNYVQGVFAAPPLTSPDIYAMRVAAAILRDLFFTKSASNVIFPTHLTRFSIARAQTEVGYTLLP